MLEYPVKSINKPVEQVVYTDRDHGEIFQIYLLR